MKVWIWQDYSDLIPLVFKTKEGMMRAIRGAYVPDSLKFDEVFVYSLPYLVGDEPVATFGEYEILG